MLKQEVFDTVVNALRKQGCKSIAHDGSYCLYRGPANTKCAVGHLLLEEEYSDSLEGKNIGAEIFKDFLIRIGNDNFHVLSSLQSVHDTLPVANWEDEWRCVAVNYDLVYTPPQA